MTKLESSLEKSQAENMLLKGSLERNRRKAQAACDDFNRRLSNKKDELDLSNSRFNFKEIENRRLTRQLRSLEQDHLERSTWTRNTTRAAMETLDNYKESMSEMCYLELANHFKQVYESTR